MKQLKYDYISVSAANLKIARAAELGTVPSCDIISVFEEFRNPRDESFKLKTAGPYIMLYGNCKEIFTCKS